MKTSTLDRNGISTELVDLVSRLVDLIPWPERRRAMGDVTLSLLDGKYCVAEDVFGWGRSVVHVGINELKTGISCVNDISTRTKLKTEEKNPGLLVEICIPGTGIPGTVYSIDIPTPSARDKEGQGDKGDKGDKGDAACYVASYGNRKITCWRGRW